MPLHVGGRKESAVEDVLPGLLWPIQRTKISFVRIVALRLGRTRVKGLSSFFFLEEQSFF